MEGQIMADGDAPPDIAQLVADHHAVLYRYAYRLSGSVADAEDLTQQVFLIAQQKLDQVRDPHKARSWLFTVLRNCYLKNCRRPPPRTASSSELDLYTVPEAVSDQDDQEIDGDQLQAAIGTLADEFKLVVLLFYFEHRSYREIAELLDVPLGTVMSRLARAKAQLRRVLSAAAAREQAQVNRSEVHGFVKAFEKPTAIRR
jgi:RNA polymerase sigma-70 factor, ECF subfamily